MQYIRYGAVSSTLYNRSALKREQLLVFKQTSVAHATYSRHSTNSCAHDKQAHSLKLLFRALVIRRHHLMQCLSVHCEVAGGVVHEETLDLSQETRWDPRYSSISDVRVLRQSCAHTHGLRQTMGDAWVNPWAIRKLPLLLKDNGHLPTLHTSYQSPHPELVVWCLQTVKHKTEHEMDGAEMSTSQHETVTDTIPYHWSQVRHDQCQASHTAVLQYL